MVIAMENSACANTIATAAAIEDKEQKRAKLVQSAVSKIQPAVKYFGDQMEALKAQIELFRAAKVFSPTYISTQPCDSEIVDQLSYFTFLRDMGVVNKSRKSL